MGFIRASKMEKLQIKILFDEWTNFLLLLLIINALGMWLYLNGSVFVAAFICGLMGAVIIPIYIMVMFMLARGH